jgi:Glycosyl transferase family 8
MITEVRCAITGDAYRRALAVALDSLNRHNPSFCRSIVVMCPGDEVAPTVAALGFLPRVSVLAHSSAFEQALASVGPRDGWLVDRFRSLELLRLPGPATGGDVLLLDADTLTVGSLSDLERDGDVVACGEGARHLGLAVDRTTNAMTRTLSSPDAVAATFNSGVVKLAGAALGPDLLQQALDVMAATDWSSIVRPQHDQLVLNRMFESRWTEVSPRNNFLLKHAGAIWSTSGVSVTDACLLHYNVTPRPWADAPTSASDPQVRVAIEKWRLASARLQLEDGSADRKEVVL